MIENVHQLKLQIEQLAGEGNFEIALDLIKSTASAAFWTSRRRQMLCFGSVQLDEICACLGSKIGAQAADIMPIRRLENGSEAPLDLYIASHLYDDGGHTPLIGDFIRANPGRRAFLAITNIDNAMDGIPKAILDYAGVTTPQAGLCGEATLLGKFRWLADVIARLQPDRVFLFNHPHDSVAISACAALVRSNLVFVHHVDRNPCLGAFLQSALHLDISPFCYFCCREKAGLARNVFVPLVAKDEGYRPFGDESLRTRPLITASAGNESKFRLDYLPNYIDAVVAILRAGSGRHIHIGRISDDYLRRFHAALRDADIPADRIMLVPRVPSLWKAMLEFGVDLFVNSFPDRGARATVEVMGSGTPIVWHVGRAETWFHDTHMKYDEAETWQTLDDLSGIVRNINDGWLQFQSHAARLHYEQFHAPGSISRYLSEIPIQGCGTQLAAADFDRPILRSLDEILAMAYIDR